MQIGPAPELATGRGANSPHVNGQASHLAEALALAAAGYQVFPVRLTKSATKIDKTPLTAHGHTDATTNPDIVTGWWRRYPDAAIGLALPAHSVVVDLDTCKPEYDAHHGLILPASCMQETGSGGWQLFYRTDGREARQIVGVRPAIDTRVAGKGWVVAWQPDVLLALAPADWTPAPEWVYETRQGRAQPISGAIPDGRRHADLVSLAGSMRARGMEPDETGS